MKSVTVLKCTDIVACMSKMARDLRNTLVGALPRYAYVALVSRMRSGNTFCELDLADAYRSVQHMLDDHGVLKPKFRGVYSTTLAAAKRKCLATTNTPVKDLLYDRLLDHLKKNRVRRKVNVAAARSRSRDVDARCAVVFGYSVNQLMRHAEGLFDGGMSWDRVVAGDIQLDHEIPVRCFDLSTAEGIKRAYALSNTRPLWRGDNARKGRTKDLEWLQLFGEGSIK